MAKKKRPNEIVSNREAYHHFTVLETLEAGIALQGTEVKSLREGGANLRDNYVTIYKNEAWLKMSSIAPYKFGNIYNHEEKRDRKLLLHKKEIDKLKKTKEMKGLTLIALSLYWSRGHVKVEIGICKGKKLHDKRDAIKKKEQMQDIRNMNFPKK